MDIGTIINWGVTGINKMKNFLFAGLAVAALTGLSLPAVADNWVVDFDTDSQGAIAPNTIFPLTLQLP